MSGERLTPAQVLDLIPQKRPFRFVDEILELDEEHAVGRYTFRPDELFYAGHFPGKPITPGVILIEAMAQVGVVALGIFLYTLTYSLEEARTQLTVFTESEAEFHAIVRPGDQVTAVAHKVFWRRKKLKSRVELKLADGRLAASAVLGGIGVTHAEL